MVRRSNRNFREKKKSCEESKNWFGLKVLRFFGLLLLFIFFVGVKVLFVFIIFFFCTCLTFKQLNKQPRTENVVHNIVVHYLFTMRGKKKKVIRDTLY